MIYLSIGGSFGGFSGKAEFSPGLNIICAPNEWGKSTLCAMLRAALYGIPTRGKEKDALLKYSPWSGRPMHVELLLLHEGRRILITRSSGKKGPLREFSAIYEDSGEAVPGLDGDNAGEVLTGLPYEAFARSVFFCGESIAVTKSDDLERKVNALATTGDEDISQTAVIERLKKWQNERKTSRNTGRIPAILREISAIEESLFKVNGANAQVMALQEELSQKENRERELSALLSRIKAAENVEKLRELETARQRLLRTEAAADAFRREKNLYGDRADRDYLSAAEMAAKTADGREMELELARAEHFRATAAAEEKPLPREFEIFEGCTPEYIGQKAAEDAEFARKGLMEKPKPGLFIAAAACILLAIISAVLPIGYMAIKIVFALVFLASAIALGLIALKNKSAVAERRKAAMELLSAYGAKSPEEFKNLAVRYRHYAEEIAFRSAEAREKALAVGQAQDRLMFARAAAEDYAKRLGIEPGRGMSAAVSAIMQDLFTLSELENSARLEKATLDGLEQRAREQGWEDTPADEDIELPDRYETLQALTALQGEIEECREKLHRSSGLLSGLPDIAELEAKLFGLREQLRVASYEHNALDIAISAFAQGGQELSRRLTPLITEKSARFFSELTGQKYERLVLTKDFDAKVSEADSELRPAEALSRGAGDQLYLSVRLALAGVLSEKENPPVVLDDPLLSFDDERARMALELLEKEGKSRQVLLLTCRARDLDVAPKGINIIDKIKTEETERKADAKPR